MRPPHSPRPNPSLQRALRGLCFLSALACLVSSVHADLEGDLRQTLAAANMGDTRVGICVADADSGRTLASINADEPLIPASNMKLLTTAAALQVLGPEFLFATELGIIDPDTADNAEGGGSKLPSLVIHGDGDPGFADPYILQAYGYKVDQLIDAWVKAVVDTGQTHFDSILVDDRVFDRHFVHPDWPERELTQNWSAQVAGINFYQNLLQVMPKPAARVGDPPTIGMFPYAPFLETSNRARTASASSPDASFWIGREPGTNRLSFHGPVTRRDQHFHAITLHDPPDFFAHLLRHRLSEANITVDRIVRAEYETPAAAYRPLHVVRTTLPAILKRTNSDSQNMFAEALYKRMGHAVTGRPGSFESGGAAVRAAIRELLGDPTLAASVTLADGSGLSRSSRVSPRVFAAVLVAMHADPERGPIFEASLAVAGESGTLRRRFAGWNDRVRVLGKSGSLMGVRTLSGYLQVMEEAESHPLEARSEGLDPDTSAAASPRPTRTIAFSLLFNDYPRTMTSRQVKELHEALLEDVREAVMPAAAAGVAN